MLEEVKTGAMIAVAAAVMALATPARAGIIDWYLSPLSLDLGDWRVSLGGEADGALYAAHQPGKDRIGATSTGEADAALERHFANGWRAGIRASFNVWHDTLSADNYGDDFVQKTYGFVQTPYGRFELGQQDGAAYKMEVTGPLAAPAAAIDDAGLTFFKTPAGAAFTDFFNVRTGVFASENFAKISYYSPRLFGIQLGGSYTPHMAKDVLPFVSNVHVANRQENILEGAANYEGHFGALTLNGYAGLALAHNAAPTPGHDDLTDFAVGGEAQYNFGEQTFALGGAYRQSNGYTFDPGNANSHGNTHAVHASAMLTTGPWKFGLEYSDGVAGAQSALPRLDAKGYEAAIGYEVNTNLQIVGGFQQLYDKRSNGAFYNGKPHIRMNAGFLNFHFHV